MGFKKNLALNASAGSGKTFALSVRYIALLLQGAQSSSIVALTFTKKAANEMRERVFDTLQNLEHKNSELAEICNMLELEEDDILKKRDIVLDSFLKDNIKISTIDSFFALILKKFSLHLGLMPNFSSYSTNSNKRLLQSFIKQSKQKNAYNSLIHFANTSRKSLDNFFQLFANLYEKDSEINEHKFERSFYPNDSDILTYSQNIKEYLKKLGASDTAIGQFGDEDFSKLMQKGFWEYESLNYKTFSKVYTQKLDEMFFELQDLVQKFYEQKEKYLLGELFFLYGLYKNARINEAKQRSELSFMDITNAVYLLLHEHIDKDFLYFRLDSKIEHLLIDEFQDTNIVQYKILEPLIEEINSGIGVKKNRSFFYVGDIKQSIYRFRGGAKVLFSHVAKKFNIEIDSLSSNYRSTKNIVDFINETFSSKITDYKNQIPTKENGYVEVFSSLDEITICDEIYLKIQELLEKNVAQEDIAILCSTNKDASTVREFLQKKGSFLRVSTENTPLLICSKNVEIVLEFLKYAYFKDELFGRNFQALIGNNFENLPKLSGFDFFDNPTKAIVWAINEFEIDINLDLLNFLKISSSCKDIENLLFTYEDINEKALLQSNNGIKILTIHKSKGLEFPYVFVLDNLSKEKNRNDELLYKYDGATLKSIFYNMKSREYVDENYKNALHEENKLRNEDKLNKQYVAFTRAKQGLIVVVKQKSSSFEELELKNKKIGTISASEKLPEKAKGEKLEYENFYFGPQNERAEKKEIVNIENIYFGLSLHYTLEMMSSFNEKALLLALVLSKNRYGYFVDENAFLQIKTRILNLLKHEEFNKLISKGAIYKEQPFIYQGKQKQVDLMVEDDDKITIIDYKSSEYISNFHTKQVQEYKTAFEKISTKKVEAYLLYLREDSIEIINL